MLSSLSSGVDSRALTSGDCLEPWLSGLHLGIDSRIECGHPLRMYIPSSVYFDDLRMTQKLILKSMHPRKKKGSLESGCHPCPPSANYFTLGIDIV